jgi:RimJ/RimL family protein N-acetyltransferase
VTELTPHLQTRRVALRPAGPEAGRTVYGFLSDFGTTALGDPDTFAAAILADVNALFTVRLRRSDTVIGFAMLQKFRPGRHVEVGVYTDDDLTPLGAGAEATLLLVNYAFAALGVRKVYSVTTEHSREGFGVAFADEHREALLPGHFYFQGELWDAHYYAVTRDEWLAGGSRFLEQLTRPPATGAA